VIGTLKLDEEESKHAGLADQNGFGGVILHQFLRLVKGTEKLCTCKIRANKNMI
jgi:hypothetical protein